MFEGMYLGEKYRVWLDGLKKKKERAEDLGKDTCQQCGYCCACRPCIPTPDELKKIAKFLNMDLIKMVKKYCVGDSMNSVDMFIFPAKTEQLDITGTYIDYRRTYDKGYCVFYDKKGKVCKIHAVKPYSAQTMKCWEEETDDGNKKAIESWKGINIKEFGIVMPSDDDNEPNFWEDDDE